jgi:DNA-binding MarR family transcriptional regulator
MPRPRHQHSSHQAAEALARTAPLVSRWIERLLAAHQPPLTVAQYLVLQAVGDGAVVGSELATRAAVSPAAVSQLLAALETADLLTRERLPGDRRRQPLMLTELGRATLHSAQALVRNRLATLLIDLPAPEADQLARLLEKLEHTLGGTAPPRRPRPPARPSPPRKDPRR